MVSKSGFRWQKRICVDCGKEYIATSPNSVRCVDCRATYRTRYMKKWSKERYKREREAIIAERKALGLPEKLKPGPKSGSKPKKIKDPNECKKTRQCIYGDKVGGMCICNYMEIVGHKRPCPVKGCTEFKRKGERDVG